MDAAPSGETKMSDRGLNRLYRYRFVRDLGAMLRERAAAHPGWVELDGLDGIRDLRTFDERFTAPLGGFGDVDTYYREASAASVLDRIRVPTTLIAAEDDPLVPFAPFRALGDSPWIRLVRTRRGGHVAFVGRRPARSGNHQDPDLFWAENRVVQLAAGPY